MVLAGGLLVSPGYLIDTLKQLRKLHFKCRRQCREGLQTGFPAPQLKVGDVILVQSSLLGGVKLTLPTILPKLADLLSEHDADVACHPYYGRVRLNSPSLLS